MATLYSNELRQLLRTREWPRGLKWAVVEYSDCLRIRFYRENINSLDSADKLQLAKVLNETLTSIQSNGIPFYTEVVKESDLDGTLT